MLTHQDILDKLRVTFPEENGVALVARYADNDLQLPERRAHIFIGDCHMLNDDDTLAYPKYQFLQEQDLNRLLSGLIKLKKDSPGHLRVWHLGDLFDVWRARGGLGDEAEMAKIASDRHEIVDKLRGPLRARIIAGNHDYPLFTSPHWRADRYRILDNDDPDGGDIFVLHGDVFSGIERLHDNIQEIAVRFATWHEAGTKNLFQDGDVLSAANRDLDRDTPFGTEPRILASASADDLVFSQAEHYNVIDGDAEDPDAGNTKPFPLAKVLGEKMRERGHNVRLMVTGHTHWARLIKGTVAGSPFVLMDCGAWIGYVKRSQDEEAIHSGQIGVLVGNEMCLYQIGYRKVA